MFPPPPSPPPSPLTPPLTPPPLPPPSVESPEKLVGVASVVVIVLDGPSPPPSPVVTDVAGTTTGTLVV
jgi:hypothetical protein